MNCCSNEAFLPTLKLTSKALRSVIPIQTKAKRFIADAGRRENQQIMKINFQIFSLSLFEIETQLIVSTAFLLIFLRQSVENDRAKKTICGLINFSCCKKNTEEKLIKS